MRLAIGSDHAGFELKEDLKSYMTDEHIDFEDLGTFSTDSVDYPNIGIDLAQRVAQGSFDLGVLVCGTGIGMSIAANKVRGIRAALCHDTFSARASREHNDANILVLGNRVIGKGLARDILKVWLASSFLGGRHAVRVGEISDYENNGGSRQ